MATDTKKRPGGLTAGIVQVCLGHELIDQIDRLAESDERSRSAEIRFLLREAIQARLAKVQQQEQQDVAG